MNERDITSPDIPETADIETSSPGYEARFAGPAGRWMLGVQERIVLGWMAALPRATVLDVGGGHGQLAIPLAAAGHRVTVLGSDESCRGLIDREVAAGRLAFVTGSVVSLPFPDRAFDVAVSIRLLPHCRNWPILIQELCRVARRAVIVDYPARRSVNALSGLLFGLKRQVEKNTRPFTLFGHGEVERAFEDADFAVAQRRSQFFWPMVLHRILNRPRLSAALEAPARGLGLTALLGSPIVLQAERKDSR